jgi:hypothetical protein
MGSKGSERRFVQRFPRWSMSVLLVLCLPAALTATAQAAPGGAFVAEMSHLSATPEARSITSEGNAGFETGQDRKSIQSLLRNDQGKLTKGERSFLRLDLYISSPRNRALRSALVRPSSPSGVEQGKIAGFLARILSNPAYRQLEGVGAWLKVHKGALDTYLGQYRILSKGPEATAFDKALARALSGPAARVYFSRAAPIEVAGLLTPTQVEAVAKAIGSTSRPTAPRAHGASTGRVDRSFSSSCQAKAQQLQEDIAEEWAKALADAQQVSVAAEAWYKAHEAEVKADFAKLYHYFDIGETAVGVYNGEILPIITMVSAGVKEVQKVADTIKAQLPETPTRQAPGDPSMDPRPRSFKQAVAHGSDDACVPGDEETFSAPMPPSGPTTGSLAITPEVLPAAVPGAWYTHQFTVGGAGAAVTWTAKNLPEGLAINFSTGQLTGSTEAVGRFNFEVSARDSLGDTVSAGFEIESQPPGCAGNPCAVSYGRSEVTVAWACGCVNPFPTEYHGVVGYYLEPYVNGVAGGPVGHSFVLGPLRVNAPDGHEGVPVFSSGGRYWYTYPSFPSDPIFGQQPGDVMSFQVYFIALRNSDNSEASFPIGMTNSALIAG